MHFKSKLKNLIKTDIFFLNIDKIYYYLRAIADARLFRGHSLVPDAPLQFAIGQIVNQQKVLDVLLRQCHRVQRVLVAGGVHQFRAECVQRLLGNVLQTQAHVDNGQEHQRGGALHVELHGERGLVFSLWDC